MIPPPAERLLGEYRLQKLIAENPVSRTWLAEQVSVSRMVLVDELREDAQAHKAAFLADIRAKAAVDHPLVGSVFEAVAKPEQCYYAHELLSGMTLAERETAGLTFLPVRLCQVLRRIAEAQLQHEALGHATSAFTLDAVHLDEHGVIRLKNLAIAGPRDPAQSAQDIRHLGHALTPMVTADEPGSTRMLTLFSWMRGEGLEAPITWGQTRDFCMQIEHQLTTPVSSLTPTQAAIRGRTKQPVLLIAVVTIVAVVGIIAFTMKMRPPVLHGPPRTSLPVAILVPAGKYPTPDGTEEILPAFRISAHETTIGQYAEFLETLRMLANEKHEHTFDHAEQPPEKSTHQPTAWPALLTAAKAEGIWQDQALNLDSPVMGVDWWDAAAYAEWKKARLPTQEEWFAALSMEVVKPAAVQPGPWTPVTAETTDRTPAGMIGMAGSVCEWTAKPATNPANPLGEKLWVLVGGSYLKPGSNATTREWTDDRALHRPDLGFRVVFEAK